MKTAIMKTATRAWVAVAAAALLCAPARGAGGDVVLATCTGAQFFDVASLTCAECPSPSVPLTDAGVAVPAPAMGGGVACGCPAGFKKVPGACGTPSSAAGCFACVSCATGGLGVSADGAACVVCNGTSALAGTSGRCECPAAPATYAALEFAGAGGVLVTDCARCPARTARDAADPSRCVACGGREPHM